MKGSLHRRIDVASFWASTRISFHDGFEQYEDSYAITQEFREWITCSADHPEQLKTTVLMVPNFQSKDSQQNANDYDQMLEI